MDFTWIQDAGTDISELLGSPENLAVLKLENLRTKFENCTDLRDLKVLGEALRAQPDLKKFHSNFNRCRSIGQSAVEDLAAGVPSVLRVLNLSFTQCPKIA